MVVAIFAVVLAAGAGYLWWRLIRGTTTQGPTRRWVTVLAVLLTLAPIAADALNMYLPPRLPPRRSGSAFADSGDGTHPLHPAPPRTGQGRTEARMGLRRDPGQMIPEQVVDPSRSLFIGRTLAVAADGLGSAGAGAGAWFANTAPVVRRVPVIVTGLDSAFDGFRIVLISDVHLSSVYGGSQLRRVIKSDQQPEPRYRRRDRGSHRR